MSQRQLISVFFYMSLQFSDTTNELGIIQECEEICALGEAGITGDANKLNIFTRNCNKYLSKAWHLILMAYGGWQYDDSNQTDLPAAADTLTADQKNYALPSEALTVRGVEIQNEGGVWRRLFPLTEELIRDAQAMSEFQKTSSTPLYYQLVGDSVRIYPPANYTQAGSFKVYFDRGSVAFASTDTTKQPGFASPYHHYIASGASLEYLKNRQPNSNKIPQLRLDVAQYEKELKEFYQQRFHQMFPSKIIALDAMRENN